MRWIRIWAVLCVTSILGFGRPVAADDTAIRSAFLTSGDHLLFIHESACPGTGYVAHVAQSLATIYPDAFLRVSALVSSGGVTGLVAAIRDSGISNGIVAVMMGGEACRFPDLVADATDDSLTNGLAQCAETARARACRCLLLTMPRAGERVGETGQTGATAAAEAALAAELGIPIVDTAAACRRELSSARRKDPRYEFAAEGEALSSPAHAAMAVEVLSALGAGLPLADSTTSRGAISPGAVGRVSVDVKDGAGVVDEAGGESRLGIRIRIRNPSRKDVTGRVGYVLGEAQGHAPVSMSGGGTATVMFDVPPAMLPGRWGALPLYATFQSAGEFDSSGTLFFYSRAATGVWQAATLTPTGGAGAGGKESPVSDVTVERQRESFHLYNVKVAWTWNDANPVACQPVFTNGEGREVQAPLDMDQPLSRQPCDAVECFLDVRPDESRGRWTSDIHSNLEGVVRVGVCRTREDDRWVPRLVVAPAAYIDTAKLAQEGDRYVLEMKIQPLGAFLGFSLRATDCDTFGDTGARVFDLTRQPECGPEPMGYVGLGAAQSGLFYRIGY